MEASSSEYEFLDLTDINEEERSSLNSALFAPAPVQPPVPVANWSAEKTEVQVTWTDPNYAVNDAVNMTPLYVVQPHAVDLSSCSSGTPGPPTTSSSLDSLPTEREMAPHSPQRNAPPHTTATPPVQPPPQLVYSQPPPPMYNSAPPSHWPQHLMPPNVYVSQVTANVNVHGYMGQYYQPQYVQHPTQTTEPRVRDGRDRAKGRRGGMKRTQSPTATPYLYYPQYYPTPQTAQGAPIYHLPMYHPMSYVASGYPYVPYVDYGIMEDPNNPGEKGPEEYPPEMMMDQEHLQHEVYYPQHPACLPAAPMYDPTRSIEGPCSIEPYPQFYQMPPPVMPTVHQFNVHAKNFVRQNEHKNYNNVPQESKIQENMNQGKNINNAVDALPMKELKIVSNKLNTPKQVLEKTLNTNVQMNKNTSPASNDKMVPKLSEVSKPVWNVNNNVKIGENNTKQLTNANNSHMQPATTVSAAPVMNKQPVSTTSSVQNKVTKPPPVPFVNKPFLKSGPSQQLGAVIFPQQGLPSKAPFANKHKKETPNKSQEADQSNEAPSVISPTPIPEAKQLPSTKPAPPVAIPVHNQNTTSITSKAPFGHGRKSSISTSDNTQAPTPPQAPTASDFPLPPASRRSNESGGTAPTVVQPLSTGRTWASLFGNSSSSPIVQNEEVPAQQANIANQRPIAKVGPYDASPLQNEGAVDKGNVSVTAEKTSNHAQKKECASHELNSPVPVHINDPVAYRMGEFLSKYQLNHCSVSLQPRGLCNRSNYCYINAILQALIACPPFYNMLKSLPYQLKKGKSNTPIIDALVELCGEFTPLPPGQRINRADRAARNSPAASGSEPADVINSPPPVPVGVPFEPSTVLHMLRDMNNGDSFRVEGRQEDAEEFLGCLLNGLNDEMLELVKLVDPEDAKDAPVIVNGNDANQESDDDDEWKVMGPKNKGSVERRCLAGRTPLSDIFRGLLRSRLQRATDSAMSDTTHCVQPFFTLPLDIERSNSVREALERVAGKDRLEGVTCPSRGRLVEAWQQVLLEELPTVLLLHLKCFHSRPSDGATVKIVKNIDYTVDLKIDSKILSPKIKYNPKQKCYKLFAVVYHEGSEAEKGHYLTDVYHVGCGGWLRYDDSVVTSVTESQVLRPRAPRTPYLLLYRRQDTVQPARQQQTATSTAS